MVAGFEMPKDATYRESLEENLHGIPVFSPLCGPQYKQALQQNEHSEDIRWGVPKVPPVSAPQPSKPLVTQFNDAPSARSFSTDPSYAERASRIPPGALLPADTNVPALALYHHLKKLELDALVAFKNQQAIASRLPYIKPRDETW